MSWSGPASHEATWDELLVGIFLTRHTERTVVRCTAAFTLNLPARYEAPGFPQSSARLPAKVQLTRGKGEPYMLHRHRVLQFLPLLVVACSSSGTSPPSSDAIAMVKAKTAVTSASATTAPAVPVDAGAPVVVSAPSSPTNIPADFVPTPGGWSHPSCIHPIPRVGASTRVATSSAPMEAPSGRSSRACTLDSPIPAPCSLSLRLRRRISQTLPPAQ
jgi:hypothetical protein